MGNDAAWHLHNTKWSVWQFYPSILPVTDEKCMFCEKVVTRKFHSFSETNFLSEVTIRSVSSLLTHFYVCGGGGWVGGMNL